MREHAIITVRPVSGSSFRVSDFGETTIGGRPGYWMRYQGEVVLYDAQAIHAIELVPCGGHACAACGRPYAATASTETGGIIPPPEGKESEKPDIPAVVAPPVPEIKPGVPPT